MILDAMFNKLKKYYSKLRKRKFGEGVKIYTREPIDCSHQSNENNQPEVNIILAASELLYLISILRQKVITNAEDYNYHSTLEKINSFKRVLSSKNLSTEQITQAKYLICAALDEANAENNSQFDDYQPQIDTKGFVDYFYNEKLGGEFFFNIVNNLSNSKHKNFNLIRFTYVLLKLGFKGKYGIMDNGAPILQSIENQLYLSIMSQDRSNCKSESNLMNKNESKYTLLITAFGFYAIAVLAAYCVFDNLLISQAKILKILIS